VSDVTTPDAACANAYVRVRTWNFTDGCGNTSANFVQTITVEDNTAPVITCPITSPFTRNTDTGVCTYTAQGMEFDATATDNCSGPVTIVNDYNNSSTLSGAVFPVGMHVITWTATDACNNSSTCQITINVTDNQPPIITGCPTDQVLNTLASDCSALASWAVPSATDNCGVTSFTYTVKDADGNDISVINLGAFIIGNFPLGVNTVTYTAADASGNTSICSFTITVNDPHPPKFNGCPPTVSLQTIPGECGAIASWNPPTGSDNCPDFIVTSTHNPGEFFDVGTTMVTYTITDASFNSAICSFNVVVTDTQNPTITCNVTSVPAVNAGNCTYEVPDLTGAPYVTANDNCPGATVSQYPLAGALITTNTTVTLTVTDGSGKTASCSIQVTVPAPLTASATSTDVTCFGDSDGTATVSAAGGTAPYTYLWSNTETTSSLTGLDPGTYIVTVTDANGCSATASATITEPDELTLSTSHTDINCNGDFNGTATVTPAGGTAPYSYLWSANAGNQTGSTAIALGAGTYMVTVTDDNGCSATTGVTIMGANALSISLSVTNITCNGLTDGAATATVTGGTGPYDFLWSNMTADDGVFSSTINNLAAGTYTVTVTDKNGCIISSSLTITQPAVLTASISGQTNVTCNGGSDGSATAAGAGGTPDYSYQWPASAGSQTTATATGLSAGTYSVTVTDDNGCTAIVSVTITQPGAISLVTSKSDPTCHGYTDGIVGVSASGGVPAYTFLWSNGATTPTQSGLGAGTYDVTVTDAAGCTAIASVMLDDPAMITISGVVTDVLCHGAATGEIDLTIGGGTGALERKLEPRLDERGSDGPDGRSLLGDGDGCERM
jgi:hypothetical protein